MAHTEGSSGFESGPQTRDEGSEDKVKGFLARYEGGMTSPYDMLRDAFVPAEGGIFPAQDWDLENVDGLLRRLLGQSEDFALEYAGMSAEEKARNFDEPSVLAMANMWAHLAEDRVGHAA